MTLKYTVHQLCLGFPIHLLSVDFSSIQTLIFLDCLTATRQSLDLDLTALPCCKAECSETMGKGLHQTEVMLIRSQALWRSSFSSESSTTVSVELTEKHLF